MCSDDLYVNKKNKKTMACLLVVKYEHNVLFNYKWLIQL